MPRATTCKLTWSDSKRVYELHTCASDVSPAVQVESFAWFAWLEQASSFAFSGQAGSYTARRESRRVGDSYWYAYARVAGKLAKRYLGRDSALTTARLEHVARLLHGSPHITDAATVQVVGALHRNGNASEMAIATVQKQAFVPLLSTKMHMPQMRTTLVPRPQLLAELQRSMERKLTLIVAPAGFGKTTIVSAWLQATPMVTAWLSLESGDDELLRFWSYIFSALRADYPVICETLLEQLQTSLFHKTSSIEHVLTSFINVLVAQPQEMVLVLDDYHTITSSAIHTSLTFLLEHLPTSMHLVLITRSDPPLPLARLQARAQLLEVRTADLRFTLDEARFFLNTVLEIHLSTEEVALLAEYTEGWPAALQFAGLSLRKRSPGTSVASALGGNQRYLVAYLAAEVFQHQPTHVQAFLLSTAVLARLNEDLCATVTGRSDSQEILAFLEEANLFVVALDTSRSWYRYHQLFSDFLLARLRELYPEQLAELHGRAATWYEAHGYLSEALHHLHEIGNSERLVDFIETWSEVLIKRGEFSLLNQWIEHLPAALLHTRPQLCLASAKTLTFLGRLEAAEERLRGLEKSVEALEAMPPAELDGEILATRALSAAMRLDTARAVALAQQALACLPQEHVFIRSVLMLSLGIAYRIHNVDEASKALREAMRQADNPHMAVMSICQFAYQLYLQGQLHQAFELYQHALECVPDGPRIPAMSIALLGCGEIQREWNCLEVAERLLEEAVPLGREWTFLGVSTGIIATLALVKQARGKLPEARTMLHEQLQLAEQQQDVPSTSTLHAYLAQLDLAENRQNAAVLWAENFARGMQGAALNALHERAYLVLAHVWIASGQYAESAAFLMQLLAMAEADGRMLSVLKILVLQVLLCQQQGDQAQALNKLARALALAEPEGYIRAFVEVGSALVPLLAHMIEARQQNAASFQQEFSLAYAHKVHKALEPVTQAGPLATPEPLNAREYEIMRLIAAGLANQQIAEQLIIALSTVKWHIRQIYTKLNVHSRTQMLVHARAQRWL